MAKKTEKRSQGPTQKDASPLAPEEPPQKEIPRGRNAEVLKKFINDARATRPYHNLAINLDWLNWAMDYLILAEKEGFTVDEKYLRIPGPSPTSPEPKVMFWDLDLGKKIKTAPPSARK